MREVSVRMCQAAADIAHGRRWRVHGCAVGHGRSRVGGWAAVLELAVSGYVTAIGMGVMTVGSGPWRYPWPWPWRSPAPRRGTVFLAAG